MKKKNIKILCLSLFVFGVLIHLIFAENFIFSDNAIPMNQTLEIQGSKPDDTVVLTKNELDAMPMSAKVNGSLKMLVDGEEKEIFTEGIKMSYLLSDFCGIKVKEADILFSDKGKSHREIKKISDLLDHEKAYTLVYKVKDNEGKESNDFKGKIFMISNDDGRIKDAGTIFYVNEILINSTLEVKEMPKLPPKFSDIGPKYEYAREAIVELAKLNIISENSESKFFPQNPITRAYLCKLLVDSLDLKIVNYNNEYSDVSVDDWYAQYITTCVSHGLISGYTDGTFGPNSEINRQEFAILCAEILLKTGKVKEEEIMNYTLENSSFVDKDSVFGWVENCVAYLEELGIYKEYLGNELLPLSPVSRAEAIYVIYRLIFQ